MFLPHFPFSQVDAQQVAFFLGSYAIALAQRLEMLDKYAMIM
jgi:hypothetical protein